MNKVIIPCPICKNPDETYSIEELWIQPYHPENLYPDEISGYIGEECYNCGYLPDSLEDDFILHSK